MTFSGLSYGSRSSYGADGGLRWQWTLCHLIGWQSGGSCTTNAVCTAYQSCRSGLFLFIYLFNFHTYTVANNKYKIENFTHFKHFLSISPIFFSRQWLIKIGKWRWNCAVNHSKETWRPTNCWHVWSHQRVLLMLQDMAE